MYKVEWEDKALESLIKLGKIFEKKIRNRVENNLAKNPTGNECKPLKGELKGFWRYRCFGNYRVVYEIFQSKLIIRVLEAGHRSNIYPKSARKYGK